jgi:hypothetical protein
MAAKLGAIFTRCALGPVSYAGGCIMASKVPDGLRELGAEGLWGGLERGITEVAVSAGVTARDVESVLPMASLRQTMAELGAAQAAAVAAWQLHAGHLGGLMTGIADLTVDARAPDVGLCLDRLAKKVSRDRPLAEPLAALASAVWKWSEALEAARVALDDDATGGRLAQAFRARRLKRAGLFAALVLVPVTLGGLGARVAMARSRVDAALSATDGCGVEAIAADDLARASEAQARAVAERKLACAAARAAEAKAKEAERARLAALEAEKKQRAEREARCGAFAEHAAAGTLDEADAALAGDAAALFERALRKRLAPQDLGPEDAKLPCLESKAADVVRAVWAKAVVAAPWPQAEALSPASRAAIVANAAAVPRWAKGVAAKKATDAAKRAVVTGDGAAIAEASAACAFVAELGWPTGAPCTAAAALAKR